MKRPTGKIVPYYLKISSTRQEWLGKKFYKTADDTDTVVQVCLVPGEMRRGRPNSPGIIAMSKVNFFANLGAYTTPATKKEFEKAFDNIVKLLK